MRNPRNPLCKCGHTLSQHERQPNENRETTAESKCGFCSCKKFNGKILVSRSDDDFDLWLGGM